MDNLRWLLLGIGALIIAGIYLAERYKRSRRQRHAVDRFFEEDYEAGFSITPKPADEDSDYRDSLADLGQLLAQSRDAGGATSRRRPGGTAPRRSQELELEELPELRHDAEPAPAPVTQPRTQDLQLDVEPDPEFEPEVEAAAEAEPEPQPQPSQSSQSAAPDEPERLIIFYLKSPPGSEMPGPDLFRALANVDMTLGEMGIYHDLDSSRRPVFSAANMFEPGTLESSDPANFSTRGLALFMRLPGPADEEAAFDRMLAKAELLADKLGAVLHDDQHQPLTTKAVERISRTLKPSAD